MIRPYWWWYALVLFVAVGCQVKQEEPKRTTYFGIQNKLLKEELKITRDELEFQKEINYQKIVTINNLKAEIKELELLVNAKWTVIEGKKD